MSLLGELYRRGVPTLYATVAARLADFDGAWAVLAEPTCFLVTGGP